MSCRQPNILLIMTDQQRFDTIRAMGNRLIRTPNFDTLCREGTAFTRAYTACPVCVAARSAILTGLPPHVTGCVDNNGFAGDDPTSVMQRLGSLGYQSHGVGKMHFTGDRNKLWGYDSRDISEEEPGPGDDYVKFLRRAGYEHVIEPHGIRSEMYYVPQPSQLPARLHHTNWVADRSLDFLARRDRSKPFFLFASFIKPHPPFENPTPWNQLYRSGNMPGSVVPHDAQSYWTYWNRCQNRYKWCDLGRDQRLERTRQAAYYGAISFIDDAIGRMLAGLGSEIDNTLILFTSDHGEFLGDYGCVGKRSMLDVALRVPLIARLPGRFGKGQRFDKPVSLLSLFPTMLSAAGDRSPHAHETAGDLSDLAAGHKEAGPVFAQYQQGRYALYMAADEHAKFVYSAPDAKRWCLVEEPVSGLEREAGHLPGLSAHSAQLEKQLLRCFEQDHYTHAAQNGSWIDYEPPVFPDNPQEGLLYQDARELGQRLQELDSSYRNPAPLGYDDPYRLLNTPEPFLRRTSASTSDLQAHLNHARKAVSAH
jgi:arylsulfatase A-like enzyme